MNQSSVNNRVVRVFVSSTFRDMVEEREALMSHTWPALRQFCREREVEFVEVDLRWGIPEEQATRKHMLKHCLDEVRACRPYFIGLLGERYGWIPGEEALTADLVEEEPWLAQHRTKSITELEILHGVLNNPEMAGRAFFYLRDPAYAQVQGPEFLPEDATNAARQRDLKDLIREICATQKIPLREHYPDPRRVAELVLEDLQAAIDADYPKESIPDPLTRDARGHEAFAEVRRRTYIGRPDYFHTLDQHAQGDGQPLVLMGKSGSGKSALLANWIAHWRTSHPQDLLIQHYIGSTPDSTDHWQLMRRIIAEIKRWTEDPEEVPHTHDDLLKTFPVWLAKARIKADRDQVRCILVLDALSQLHEQDHARLLGWLPTHSFAGSLRMIASTLPDETLQVAESRGWASVTVEPLTTEERRRMIAAYLGRFRKRLDEPRVEKLANASQTENPLYLKILLDELRVTGTHDQLDDRLNRYLNAPDIPALLQLVLTRYQRDYEHDRPGLVGDTLGLIWAARRGLSETELLEMLKPADQPQLPQAMWAPLRAGLEDFLIDRGNLLNFSHEYLREAVARQWLRDMEVIGAFHLQVATYFSVLPNITIRMLDELPWQMVRCNQWSELASLLGKEKFFTSLWMHNRFELSGYWFRIESATEFKAKDTYQEILQVPDRCSNGEHVLRVRSLLADLGYKLEVYHLDCYLVEHLRSQGRRLDFAGSLINQGNYFLEFGPLSEANRVFKQAEEIFRDCSEHGGLMSAIGNRAIVALLQRKSKEAFVLAQDQERLARALGAKSSILRSLHTQASAKHLDNEVVEADRLLAEAERLSGEIGDSEALAYCWYERALHLLENPSNIERADELFRRAEIKFREIGSRHGLADTIACQACVLLLRGRSKQAWDKTNEVERINMQLSDTRLSVRLALLRSLILNAAGKQKEAEELKVKAEKLASKFGLALSDGSIL